ncbi:MAG: hypothetical protein JW959_04290 [Pirellulales bacterium]|nr:hypothetical protein [Pirellulales bacterium]
MPFSSNKTAVALLFAAVLATAADARAAWREDFETPQASWSDAGGQKQGKYRILKHQRIQSDAHSDKGCEWLSIEADGGARIVLSHDVGRPPVIAELVPSVWVKSDRPGLQLAARLVLPRTIDKQTGRPVAAVVSGGSYSMVGRWQQLRLDDVPRLLLRQVHVLRMQLGPQVDGREAYLDAVLLNVYGGPGTTNIWIDDLEVAGHVSAARGPTADRPEESWQSRGVVRLPPPGEKAADGPRHSVKLSGGILLVDDRPMFPRVVRHCGEPLAVLKRIGFNAVWLKRLPTPELLEEADRLGLWLICPPPRPVGEVPLAEITPSFDCVLAWDLGDGLGEAELDAARAWAREVRAADRRGNRPLVCRPATDLRGYSRAADLLLLDRRPLGTGIEMADYANWVGRQPLLASPGTPVWTTVQTHPNDALIAQLSVLAAGAAAPRSVAPEQVRLMAYAAVAAGSRGLVFLSDSPLDAPDADAKRRATTLELINLEMELLEPWAAAGRFAASADANVEEVSGSVLGVDRAQLLLPIWSSPAAQCSPAASASETLSLIVPGVPEAANAYLLTPAGARPLQRKRVAGGVRVSLGEFDLTAQALLAHDPRIVGAVHRRAAESGRRMAELHRDLAAIELGRVRPIVARLDARTPVASAPAWLEDAQKYLQECNARLAAADPDGAALGARRAMRALRMVKRSYWDAARQGLTSPATSPAALGFETLPDHWRMLDRLAAGRLGANLLAGGDFEDVGQMMTAGWRNMFQADPNVRTSVDLAPQAARGGRLGLRMTAVAADPQKPPAALERPPVLLTGPAVPVDAGAIVCIHGWVRTAGPLAAGSDGLLIVDSLGGEALADRIARCDEWRQFALYRAAPQAGQVFVTFALTGLGEVWLDDVAVQVLEPSYTAARR